MISEALTPERARGLDGPVWLAEKRFSAAQQLETCALPTTDLEEWRYSPIEDWSSAEWRLPDSTPEESVVERARELLGSLGPLDASVILIDGAMVHCSLSEQATAAGVTLKLAGEDLAALERHPGTVAATESFDLLNEAYCRAPIYLRVPRNVCLADPIALISLVTGSGQPAEASLVTSRLVADVGENAEVALIDWLGSAGDARSLVVPRNDIAVARSARVRLVQVNNLNSHSDQVGSLLVDVGQEASFSLHYASLGGNYSRGRFEVRLSGRGASGDLNALYYGQGHQTHDLRTFQTHDAPDTTSNLVFKGALDDHSHSVYTGLIRVAENARGTNATQANRNIKLSDSAWAESVPNLEILNNDVRCAHASAVGPIDEDQRFYLESRGVPPEVAERLVVAGFFEEVLAGISHGPTCSLIRSLLHEAVSARSTAQPELKVRS